MGPGRAAGAALPPGRGLAAGGALPGRGGLPAAARPGERGGEAVIMAGHLDPAGGQVHDRLVHAPVAVAELVGVQAQRPAEDLAAQADPEHRQAGFQHPRIAATA